MPVQGYTLRLSAITPDGTAFAAANEENVPLESLCTSYKTALRPSLWSQASGVLSNLRFLSFDLLIPANLSDDASTIVATSSGPSNAPLRRPFRLTAGRIDPLPGLDGTPAAGSAERISGDGGEASLGALLLQRSRSRMS